MDWKKKLKFVAITAAFAVLILIVLTNIVKMTQVSEKDFKTYKQGLTFLEQKDYENAYFNFANVSRTSAIYEPALLRQALCADELKDSQTAVKKYKMFIEKYPESLFIQKAYYALAQNYFREKDYNKAEKSFNDIRKNFKDSEYKTASGYYLGIIYQEKAKEEKGEKDILDKKQKAKTYFEEYLTDAPNGRFAINCVENINSLSLPLSAQDNLNAGKAYYLNGMTKQAYDSLNKSNMPDSWAYLSVITKRLGDYKKSREIFEANYQKNNENQDEDILKTALENYASIHPQGIKAGWQKALELAQPTSAKGGDFILYNLCKYQSQAEKNESYRQIYTEYPKGKFASDAVANLFWQAYQRKDYQEAKLLGQIHMRDYPHTIAAPRIMFWMGKLSEKTGSRHEAAGMYQRLIEKYPDDYYAYRADKLLNVSRAANWNTKSSHKVSEKQADTSFPIKHTNISDDSVSLINTILKLNDYKLLGEIEKGNKIVQSWINYKEGKYSTAAILARNAIAEMETKPSFSDSIYKIAYPMKYQSLINTYSKMYKLDAFLVTALIREESYFNPEAGSSVGAVGLMQLMPATASYIASQTGTKYTGTYSLTDPQTNINLGCAYLKQIKTQLYNDDLLAVAAYNGGPNSVKIWTQNLSYKNFDEFIENIPYPETKDYVKKVFRSYWVYLNVY